MKCKKLLLFLPALIISCNEDELSPQQKESEIEERPIVLGERLPNPYSLSVMQKAVDELAGESTLKSAQLLQATHYYLRFAPRDTAEIDLLEADTTIFFYTYPMDYEIAQEGDTYTDPNQPEGVLKYMYCAVDVNHKLPDVPYEVLDELYILEETNVVVEPTDDEEDDFEEGNKSAHNDYWETLEMKAKEIVGAEVSYNKSKWRPQGDVYYHDTSLNKDIPLEGVPVRCRKNIFVTHQCCTNEKGHFLFDRLRGRVDYYIRWRRDHFMVREHTGLTSAETTIKRNTKSSVTYTVTHGTQAWEYASIFRAAHFYYYKAESYGLSSPSKSLLTIRPAVKKGTLNGECGFHVGHSDIHIYCIEGTSADIFCTTVHEIGHWVNLFWKLFKYHEYSDKMKDAWAGGVAWYLTSRVYDYNLFYNHLHYKRGGQYTGLVKDLIDDNSILDKTNNRNDRVSGFTISQIETAFRKNKTWNSLKEYLKSLKVAKDEDIETLFDAWE